MTDNPWTDARIVMVKELWPSESAADIATGLGGGITRNAVIGKARRLGLASKKADRAAEKKSRKRRPAQPKPPKLKPVVIHDTPPRMVTLQELEPHHCRYGLGDPRDADFRFCGADKWGESPYCRYHFHICYQPPAQREQKFHHWGRRAA